MIKKGHLQQYGTLFRIAFLILSIVILIKIVDVKLVVHHVREIPLYILGIIVGITLFSTWLLGLRWQLLNPDDSGQLGQWQCFRLLMISKPFNLIMPGAIGGDFARTVLTLKTVKNKRVDNFIAIVADRFIGLFSIIILGSASLFFMSDIPDKLAFYRLFGLLLGIFSASVLVAGNPFLLRLLKSFFLRLGRLGERLIDVLKTWEKALVFFKLNYTRVLFALLLCLPIHGLVFIKTFIIAISLGITVSFFDICIVFSLVWVITAIPITISGIGVRELTLIYFLSHYGIESEPAVALAVYLYIVTLVIGFIGLLFLFTDKDALVFKRWNMNR